MSQDLLHQSSGSIITNDHYHGILSVSHFRFEGLSPILLHKSETKVSASLQTDRSINTSFEIGVIYKVISYGNTLA